MKRILSVLMLIAGSALLAQTQTAVVTGQEVARGFFTELPEDEAGLLAYLTMLAFRRTPAMQTGPSTFDFALTGVQARVVSFVDFKGRTLRSRCEDCSFLIAESGVEDPFAVPDPGIVFKLTTNGAAVTATCRATECLIVSGTDTISRLTTTQTIPAVGPIYFRVKK